MFKTIITDEATKINNPETKMYRAIMQIKSEKRIALTGTPISNSPLDAFGLLNWLSPGYCGTFYQFKDRYCTLDPRFNNVVGFKNLDQLSKKVDRFMLRRKKEEVFKDLPSKVVENVIFSISELEQSFYKAIKEQTILEIQKLSDMDTKNLNIMVVKMIRLRQCADHPRLVGYDIKESSKLEALNTLLEPIIESGGKAIVFTEFVQMLHILNEELESKYKIFSIYGDVDSIDRMVRVKAFNDYEGPAVMLMTSAGAYGLNLASASYIVHYDLPFSIAKLEQREGRADRSADIDSRKKIPLTIYTLTAKNTIDEYLLKIINKKNRVSVDILKDASRLEDQGLSQEDIDEILRL